MSASKSPSRRRYPSELRERAVRMVREGIAENGGERFGVVTRVARQLGIGAESLRTWFNQAEVDGGQRPGVTSEMIRYIDQHRGKYGVKPICQILEIAHFDLLRGAFSSYWTNSNSAIWSAINNRQIAVTPLWPVHVAMTAAATTSVACGRRLSEREENYVHSPLPATVPVQSAQLG